MFERGSFGEVKVSRKIRDFLVTEDDFLVGAEAEDWSRKSASFWNLLQKRTNKQALWIVAFRALLEALRLQVVGPLNDFEATATDQGSLGTSTFILFVTIAQIGLFALQPSVIAVRTGISVVRHADRLDRVPTFQEFAILRLARVQDVATDIAIFKDTLGISSADGFVFEATVEENDAVALDGLTRS